MKLIASIQLFGNGFKVTFESGETKVYRVGKRADIYLKKNPVGLLWTEPREWRDEVNNTSGFDNYIIHASKGGKLRAR